MLKPNFPKKGMGEREEKEEGRNGKKEKEKDESKEKNNKKERKRRIPDQRSKRSKKGKRSNSRSMKKEDINSSKPDCHSESFLTGNIPPHMNKKEKTETPGFLSKKHYPRENPIGP